MTLSGGPLFYDSNNNTTFIYWGLYLNTPVDMTIYPQIEYGTVATAYEPYKTPQTLTLSTPGGLPGIPVTSGGNYTDESGQQWICDEIDLKRGKYVQRVGKTVVDGVNLKFEVKNGYWNLPDGITPGIMSGSLPICNICPQYGGYVGINTVTGFLFFRGAWAEQYFADADAINNFAQTTNIVFMYATESPIETDLPAEEIAAYKALHTYSPTTTVSNDAEAWMQVEYKG